MLKAESVSDIVSVFQYFSVHINIAVELYLFIYRNMFICLSGGRYILCMVLKNIADSIFIFNIFSSILFLVVVFHLGATPYIPHIGESLC